LHLFGGVPSPHDWPVARGESRRHRIMQSSCEDKKEPVSTLNYRGAQRPISQLATNQGRIELLLEAEAVSAEKRDREEAPISKAGICACCLDRTDLIWACAHRRIGGKVHYHPVVCGRSHCSKWLVLKFKCPTCYRHLDGIRKCVVSEKS